MRDSATKRVPWSAGLAALLVTLAITVAACSAGSPRATSGKKSPVSTTTTSKPAVGPGGPASSPRSAPFSGGAPSSTASTSVTNVHPNGAGGAGPSATAAPAGGQGGGPATTTTGVPPTSQQFKGDDTAFETALGTAQSSVSHLPSGSNGQQMTQALQPVIPAALLFESQIANLQWSATGKPRAQALSEDVGQLAAEIVAIERPGGFLSVGQVVAQLSTAGTRLRAASGSVDAQLGP